MPKRAHGEAQLQLHSFVTSQLHEGKWPASHPCHVTPLREVPPIPTELDDV